MQFISQEQEASPLINSKVTHTKGYGVQVNIGSANVTISGSTIEDSTYSGIDLYGASGVISINNSTIRNNADHGISLWNSSPDISNCYIEDNGGYGIYLDGTSVPTISGNNFGDAGPPSTFNTLGAMGFSASASGVASNYDSVITDPVYVETGYISSNTTWSSTRVYYINDNVTVNSGITLTIAPGRIIKFAQSKYLSINNGTLNAVGDPANKIYFTADSDDTVGGDSNGDGRATTPAPNWWGPIWIDTNSSATLDYCEISYAGYTSGNCAVYKSGTGNLTLTNSVIRNTHLHGVVITSSSGNHFIGNNIIRDNVGRGINLANNTGSTIMIDGNIIKNNDQGIYVLSSNPTIQWNSISSNTNEGIYLTTANADIYNNTIHSNDIGIYCMSNADPVIGGSEVASNNIADNTTYSVQNTSSAITVNAQFNYWGSASGPPLSGTNMVSDYVDASAYISSFYLPLGMQLWLKADAGITKDVTDYVSAWADQSGFLNDATQADLSRRPLWIEYGPGGLPTLRFDGLNDYLDYG